MNNPKTGTARFVSRRVVLPLLVGLVATSFVWLTARAGGRGATQFRWDLIHLFGSFGNVISAGGSDSAKAADGSQITLTGSGTWVSTPAGVAPQAVDGGGTWQTFDKSGVSTGSGTY